MSRPIPLTYKTRSWPAYNLFVQQSHAFRESDFIFIDIAFGPLTDIALADDSVYDPTDLEMLPPIPGALPPVRLKSRSSSFGKNPSSEIRAQRWGGCRSLPNGVAMRKACDAEVTRETRGHP
jgi:hypothetical protein